MFGIKDKLLAMLGGGLSLLLGIALVVTLISKNATIHAQQRLITAQNSRIEILERNYATCRANNGTLEAGIARQNAAYSALQAQAAQRQALAAGDVERASSAARTAAERASVLSRRVAGPDQCRSADELILESLR